jgi:hypothetical protein
MTPDDKRLKYEVAGELVPPRDTRRSIRILIMWCNKSLTLFNLPKFKSSEVLCAAYLAL